MKSKRTLGIGTLLTAAFAIVLLAAAGRAAKRTDSITCSISSGTTFTWASGTTSINYDWVASDGSQTGNGLITPNGPGASNVSTPANSVTLNATYIKKRGLSFKLSAACQ